MPILLFLLNLGFYGITICCTIQLIIAGECFLPIWVLTINWLFIVYDTYMFFKHDREKDGNL